MRRSHCSPCSCVFLVIAVLISFITWLQITKADPQTLEIRILTREVCEWLGRKYLLALSGTSLFIALSMLWLLLCDAERWLVGASDSPSEPGSATTAAAPEEVNASVQPAPGSAPAGATAAATPPGFLEKRRMRTPADASVSTKIPMLVVFTALVLWDLWVRGIVSFSKPALDVAAALAHELAGLEVVCVLFSMLTVYSACKSSLGASVSPHVAAPTTPPLSDVGVKAMEDKGESGLFAEAAIMGEKHIEPRKHSEEMV